MGLKGTTILVVEADPASNRLIATVLALAGATVEGVGSAEDAVRRLATLRPDAIVVDLVLPGAGGLALVHVVKSTPATKDVVCIALTAANANARDTEQAAMMAGCAAQVRKPIDTDTFAGFIARQLGGRS